MSHFLPKLVRDILWWCARVDRVEKVTGRTGYHLSCLPKVFFEGRWLPGVVITEFSCIDERRSRLSLYHLTLGVKSISWIFFLRAPWARMLNMIVLFTRLVTWKFRVHNQLNAALDHILDFLTWSAGNAFGLPRPLWCKPQNHPYPLTLPIQLWAELKPRIVITCSAPQVV